MFLYQLSLQISGINPRVETERGGAKRLAVRYLKFAEKMRLGCFFCIACFVLSPLNQTETYVSQAIPSITSNCCPIFETGKPMSVDDHHIYSFLHKLHEVFSLLRTRLTWQLVLKKISGFGPVGRARGSLLSIAPKVTQGNDPFKLSWFEKRRELTCDSGIGWACLG